MRNGYGARAATTAGRSNGVPAPVFHKIIGDY